MKPRGRDQNEMLQANHRMEQGHERDWLSKRCSDEYDMQFVRVIVVCHMKITSDG